MSKFSWLSFQGKLTEDNRDFHGASIYENAQCFVIADGATNSLYGRETAKALTRRVIDCFDQDVEGFNQNGVFECLKVLQRDLKTTYASGVVSYLIAIVRQDKIKVICAGDCRLGNLNDDFSISWLTPVHTLANAIQPLTHEEIVEHPDRHILTRSFKCKRYITPEYLEFSLDVFNNIVLATDGFWADISSEEQRHVLRDGKDLSGLVRDDTSVLLICGN
jgi:serine/threonine protein phosphatase PrpC